VWHSSLRPSYSSAAAYDGNGVNSIDEIIEHYKRDVDRSLIAESLRRSVEERIQALEDFQRFIEDLRRATEIRRDSIR